MNEERKLRVYLASRYPRREELLGRAKELQGQGIQVMSTWILGRSQALDATVEQKAAWVTEDLREVLAADIVVVFTHPAKEALPPGAHGTKGGYHIETGFAIAHGKPVLLVGDIENYFHHLPGVAQVDTWEEALQALAEFDAEGGVAIPPPAWGPRPRASTWGRIVEFNDRHFPDWREAPVPRMKGLASFYYAACLHGEAGEIFKNEKRAVGGGTNRAKPLKTREELLEELADVEIYQVLLSEVLGAGEEEFAAAVEAKVRKNEGRMKPSGWEMPCRHCGKTTGECRELRMLMHDAAGCCEECVYPHPEPKGGP